MDSLFSPEYFVSSTAPAALSTGALLKLGLDYVQQGDYAEGAALLTLVRTHLSSQSSQDILAVTLDAFLHGFMQYKHLQKSLQVLRMTYAETCRELQTHVADLTRVAPQFIQDFEDARYSYEQKAPGTSALSQLCAEAVPRDMPLTTAHNGWAAHGEGKNAGESHALFITCFGHFAVRRLGTPLTLCSSRKGQGIFRFLLAQPTHSATTDTLQAVFWPDEGPEVAQQKLHIAISTLRRWLKHALGEVPTYGEYITCKNALYSLVAAAHIETDVDRFLHWYHSGRHDQHDEQIACYERACAYYAGVFLTEDRYADWSFLPRERLSQLYLAMCRVVARHYVQVKRYDDAISWATALLKENTCDESAHQLLIQSYAAQGRRSEAVKQYQHCVRLLATELGVQPLPETQMLYQTLLNRSDLL